MKHELLGLALVMSLLGCAQRGAPFSNPFIGSEVVPPPGTRSLAPGQAAPYYGSGTQLAPPVVVEPSSFSSGQIVEPEAPGDDITPIGSRQPRLNLASDSAGFTAEPAIRVPNDGDAVRIRPAAQQVVTNPPAPHAASQAVHVVQARNELATSTSSPPEAYGPWRSPAGTATNVPIAGRPAYPSQQPVFTAPVGCYSCEPATFEDGPQTVEITELPPPGSRVRRQTPAAAGIPSQRGKDSFVSRTRAIRDARVRPASRTEPESPRSSQLLRAVGDSTPRTWARYGHGRSHEWLQGRLEYQRSSRQWKLRYIPIDGATDQFGGSVVLENADAYEGLRAGEFVRVQGGLISPQGSEEAYSPPYRVASLQPVAE